MLAEIWNNMTIDDYEVFAEFVEQEEIYRSDSPNAEWYAKHVRESQYLLQVFNF